MQPLLAILEDITGGFPMVTPNWKANRFNMVESLGRARQYGVMGLLFDVVVSAEPQNASTNVIYLVPPGGFGKDLLHLASGLQYMKNYSGLMEEAALYLRSYRSNATSESGKSNMTGPRKQRKLIGSVNLARLRSDVKALHELQMFLTNVSTAGSRLDWKSRFTVEIERTGLAGQHA